LFSHRSATQRTARVRLISSLAATALTAFLSILQGYFHTAYSVDSALSRCGWISSISILRLIFEESRLMVLIYESDPLDNEDARGRFYHVCRGRIDRTEIQLPADEKVYECAVCGIDLEAEDFWLARQKGSV
jgi:hypothetical protein